MEQWRLFLAIFLSIIVFAVWQYFFAPKQEEVQPPPSTGQNMTKNSEQSSPGAEESATTEKLSDSAVNIAAVSDKFDMKTIHSPLYTAVISSKGAVLTSFILEKYKDNLDDPNLKKQLIPDSDKIGTVIVTIDGNHFPDFSKASFTADYSGEIMEVSSGVQSISFFSHASPDFILEKKYTFYPDSYKIDLEIVLKNVSIQAQDGSIMISLTNPPVESKSRYGFEGPFAFVNNSLEQISIKDIKKKGSLTGTIDWAGIETQYFMSAVIPDTATGNSVRLQLDEKDDLVEVQLTRQAQAFQPATSYAYKYMLFFGPKRIQDLVKCGHQLEKAVNFGFFDIIAKPCLWMMDLIHDKVISNYGACIILLTIFFKLIFWPLGTKSYKSMAEMKKLQPLMEEIRKKYKDDKKKMNEEIMGLYRTYKVNPMSGCLPMVVQIPVFIAFYRMLYGAIELRHAPFAFWINDLSSPDRLFRFGFAIPMMTPPYGIPVLTIIMGATMLLQQKLSPPPGDPAQAKMMMMMPIVFTVIFINFPSGLVLYWLVNNILSIAQQYYITKKSV